MESFADDNLPFADDNLPFADNNLPVTWILMHNNDPKHIVKSVKSFLEQSKINVLKWPPQVPI